MDRTPEEILKVRGQKFLRCRGYLPEAKSQWKSPVGRCFFKRDIGALAPLTPSFLCQWLFSVTNNLVLRSNHPNSYHDFYTFQKTEIRALWKVCFFTFIYINLQIDR